jgi:inositol transport system substrate-binding protein
VEEKTMKKYLIAGIVSLMGTTAMADGIGVSMALFDDNFLTVLRNGIQDYRQGRMPTACRTCRSRTRRTTSPSSWTRSTTSSPPRRDAIIVNPVDTSATQAMTKTLANDAGIPLVYVNRQPVNVDTLARQAGLCRLERGGVRHAGNQGSLRASRRQGQDRSNIYVMMGELVEPGRRAAHQGHSRRDRHAGMQGRPEGTRRADRQSGRATKAQDLMTNWLAAGTSVRRRHCQQ